MSRKKYKEENIGKNYIYRTRRLGKKTVDVLSGISLMEAAVNNDTE